MLKKRGCGRERFYHGTEACEKCAKLIDIERKPCGWHVDYREEGNSDELTLCLYNNLRECRESGHLRSLAILSRLALHLSCIILFSSSGSRL